MKTGSRDIVPADYDFFVCSRYNSQDSLLVPLDEAASKAMLETPSAPIPVDEIDSLLRPGTYVVKTPK